MPRLPAAHAASDPVARLKTHIATRYPGRIAGALTRAGTPARCVDLPPDLDPRLREALVHRGVSSLYSHQRESFDLARVRPAPGRRHPHRVGQDALLQPAGAGRGAQLRGQGTLSLSHQGPGPGPGGGADRAQSRRRPWGACLYLRRRHPGRRPQGGAHPRRHRGQQPGHAPPGDPAPSHQMGPVLRGARVRCGGRAAQLPGGLRLSRGQCLSAAASHLPLLRGLTHLHLHLRHHRQPVRAGLAAVR